MANDDTAPTEVATEVPTPPNVDRRQLIVGASAAAVMSSCSVTPLIDSGQATEQDSVVIESAERSLVIGTFGTPINLGKVDDVIQEIRENDGFWYRPDGRMWLTEYPADSIERARGAYSAAELVSMEVGVVALFQKCPHLGCRVPSCASSQWFECPCHGSRYNRVGEKRGGPAPRGMDRFGTEINDDGELIVKTSEIIEGPPIGTNTTGQEAEGPSCIGG